MSEKTAETFINIKGNLVPANLQPPYPMLQESFTLKNGNIIIDIPEARNVIRNKIRAERKALFEKNDGRTMLALQRNDATALQVAKEKGDQLRLAPQDARIDSAKTPDELLIVYSEILEELAQGL